MTPYKIDGPGPQISRGIGTDHAVRSGKPAVGGPVAPAAPSDTVSLTSTAGDLRALQKELAQVPVADHARIAQVREAIASGSFRIDAQQIASRLVALDGALLK
jgi:negative regulator of flagellin synthesis FlgM